ncbi:hypothetical protein IG193_06260 [Infirmifilum lucidum]|uniref:HTH arsR-type domain-containing protein n=1 Tax=Infirmifilum lucidum TaxID=2776706 RepID=A0A7L9FEX6_9CREN|nr:hypothetical protein [Infirmifilum lucidum]QOJ78358.1 hypothetical protein IG193_06260 [Infirmifilum lucidum]
MIKVFIERALTPEDLIEARRIARLRKAYLEYEEEGEEPPMWIREEVPLEVARRLLSDKIVEIVEVLSSKKEYNITKLAEAVHRSPPNIHRDLVFLKKHRLLTFIDRGREKIPVLLFKRVVIEVQSHS